MSSEKRGSAFITFIHCHCTLKGTTSNEREFGKLTLASIRIARMWCFSVSHSGSQCSRKWFARVSFLYLALLNASFRAQASLPRILLLHSAAIHRNNPPHRPAFGSLSSSAEQVEGPSACSLLAGSAASTAQGQEWQKSFVYISGWERPDITVNSS